MRASAIALTTVLAVVSVAASLSSQQPAGAPQRGSRAGAASPEPAESQPAGAAGLGPSQGRVPDFDRMVQDQAKTDATWRAASEGVMRMDKIAYRSTVGDMDIPAFVFQPLQLRGAHGHPAIVWVHENIRGHLYEHYIPYIREATAKRYVVIAPEYRGSIVYCKSLYDALDYRGNAAAHCAPS